MRRKPTHEERWNIVQIDAMKGTPWEPVPGRDSDTILSKIVPRAEDPEIPHPELPVGVNRIRECTDFRLLRKTLRIMGRPRIARDANALC